MASPRLGGGEGGLHGSLSGERGGSPRWSPAGRAPPHETRAARSRVTALRAQTSLLLALAALRSACASSAVRTADGIPKVRAPPPLLARAPPPRAPRSLSSACARHSPRAPLRHSPRTASLHACQSHPPWLCDSALESAGSASGRAGPWGGAPGSRIYLRTPSRCTVHRSTRRCPSVRPRPTHQCVPPPLSQRSPVPPQMRLPPIERSPSSWSAGEGGAGGGAVRAASARGRELTA